MCRSVGPVQRLRLLEVRAELFQAVSASSVERVEEGGCFGHAEDDGYVAAAPGMDEVGRAFQLEAEHVAAP